MLTAERPNKERPRGVRAPIAIRGEFQPEIISQEELGILGHAQKAAWLTTQSAAVLALQVVAALERGAQLEKGPLCWDYEFKRVKL